MLLFIGLCPRQGSGSKASLQRPRSARLVPGKSSRSKLIIQWVERLHACGRERLAERVCVAEAVGVCVCVIVCRQHERLLSSALSPGLGGQSLGSVPGSGTLPLVLTSSSLCLGFSFLNSKMNSPEIIFLGSSMPEGISSGFLWQGLGSFVFLSTCRELTESCVCVEKGRGRSCQDRVEVHVAVWKCTCVRLKVCVRASPVLCGAVWGVWVGMCTLLLLLRLTWRQGTGKLTMKRRGKT